MVTEKLVRVQILRIIWYDHKFNNWFEYRFIVLYLFDYQNIYVGLHSCTQGELVYTSPFFTLVESRVTSCI